MSRVRQRGTGAELLVAQKLKLFGHAYRKNVRSLSGTPDFANKKRKWAILVNGCYWHHHRSCKRATIPKRNRDFWVSKFAANRRRDARIARILRAEGYRLLIIWECETLDDQKLKRRLLQLPKSSGVVGR